MRNAKLLSLPIVVTLIGSLFLTVYSLTPRAVPWSVAGGKLQIHASVWSDDFPLGEMQLEQTRILDLNREPGWRPQTRIRGFHGFGLNAGRFKLQNGQSVYLYLAAETTAVLITRRGDVPVMVGVSDPNVFLTALKNAAK